MAIDQTSQNPGKDVQYDPNNPYNVGVAGTGNYTAQNMPIITSDVLKPQTPINYSTPQQTPVPSFADLNAPTAPITATAPEQKASDMNARLQNLNDQLIGKSSYTTQQETAAGISALNQQQNDLQTQLTQLTKESAAITDQANIDAFGRGITNSVINGSITLGQRKNVVKALGISSMLDATRGLLASAQDKVNRAVSAKYDPISEQIDVATKNLKLITDSPEYSLADKNRAQAQLDAQNLKTKQLENNKANAATIMSWAAAAMKNGATPFQAQQIMAIGQSDKPDLTAAFHLYSPFTQDPIATQKAILDLKSQQLQNELAVAKNPLEIQQLKANIAKTKADAAKTYADMASANNNKTQQKLETDYKNTLLKEVSNRSGGLGLQDQKVNQAIHLKALIDQNTTVDANGNKNYNLTPQQYNELAMGLASLLSNTNSVSDSARQEINARTAKGDIAGAIQYITGTPQKGSTNAIVQNLVDSIDRQGEVAQQLRDQAVKFLHGLAPTDLQQSRIDALEKNTLSSYTNPVQAVGSTVTDAKGLSEGTTAVGDDGKSYVVKNGVWTLK